MLFISRMNYRNEVVVMGTVSLNPTLAGKKVKSFLCPF